MVFEGTPAELVKAKRSLTGQYLAKHVGVKSQALPLAWPVARTWFFSSAWRYIVMLCPLFLFDIRICATNRPNTWPGAKSFAWRRSI